MERLEDGTNIKVATYVTAAKSTASGLQKTQMKASRDILKEIYDKASILQNERLIQATQYIVWRPTLLGTHNRTEIDQEEFWDTLRMNKKSTLVKTCVRLGEAVQLWKMIFVGIPQPTGSGSTEP